MNMSMFIVFEGIDGSGKSTVASRIVTENENIYLTQEPSRNIAGRLAKRAAHVESSPYYDLFLYLADRVHHTQKIGEVMKGGRDVICDRYWGSTAAYQAAGGEIELDYLVEIQKPFISKPDITILFDLSPDISLQRIKVRNERSKYEKIDFLERVRENYLQLAQDHGWKIIDASKDLEYVYSQVKKIIKK